MLMCVLNIARTSCDGLEDGGAAVLFRHKSPPVEIALELLGESDGARSGSR
jgi:hypothetical protein